MRVGAFAIVLASLVLGACEASTGATGEVSASTNEQAVAGSPFADRSIGTHAVNGVLLAFEDAGFPMYGLEIGPSGSALGDPANLRLGALDLVADGTADADAIRPLVGRPVQVRYSVTQEQGMVDLVLAGEVIRTGGPATASARRMEGVLTGAESETAGDLPSEVTVTATDGTSVTFELFVDEQVVAANGQTVILRYDSYPAIDLVSIVPAG